MLSFIACSPNELKNLPKLSFLYCSRLFPPSISLTHHRSITVAFQSHHSLPEAPPPTSSNPESLSRPNSKHGFKGSNPASPPSMLRLLYKPNPMPISYSTSFVGPPCDVGTRTLTPPTSQ
ncbi:hypothetical protein V6N13_130624 [Hibiscus sabdariffa]|uniref:Uncharacterized protein n=2 Tax=Hibiscus sabdariffa TaxID=183260 RepID=A0ABR2P0W0_9ROSI